MVAVARCTHSALDLVVVAHVSMCFKGSVIRAYLSEVGFIVEDVEDAIRLASEEIDNHSVVGESDVAPAYTLVVILSLFEFEHVAVEEELQVFVRIVDTKLLQ